MRNKSLLYCFTFDTISSLSIVSSCFLEAIKPFVGWLMEKVVIWKIGSTFMRLGKITWRGKPGMV